MLGTTNPLDFCCCRARFWRRKYEEAVILNIFRRRIAIVAATAAGFAATCHAAGADIDACQLISATQTSKITGTTITVHAMDTPPGIPTPSFTDIKGLGDAAYLAKTSA